MRQCQYDEYFVECEAAGMFHNFTCYEDVEIWARHLDYDERH